MADASAAARRRGSLPRVLFVIASLFTLWHVFATFLWVSPVTPLRDVLPGNTLTAYMMPFFSQRWSVFAPDPMNGDNRLSVRALVAQPDGALVTTDWISATDVELSLSDHNLFPPRAAGLGAHASSNLSTTWQALNADQQAGTALAFYLGADWFDRVEKEMYARGSNTQQIDAYVDAERYADAYATQVARAVWGDGVQQVQVQVSWRGIIPFEQRNEPGAQHPAENPITLGWRGVIELPHQSAEDFANVFAPTYRELTQ